MDTHSLSPRRPTRHRRAISAAAAVLAVGLGLPAVVAQPVQALGPLPPCDLGDVYTVPRGYDDWSVTLVDRLLRVESDYVPPDLVKLSDVGLPGGGYIRAVAVEDTKAMLKAARAAGAPVGIWSPYRSFKEQTQIFNGYVAQNGFDSAITYSQVPGHSEHQLGLGVDFMSAGGGNPLPGDWAKTPAGAWMAKNSWKYGWVLSYPRGEGGTRWNDKSCFRYEPWHYRYLGREVAAKVKASGLTIREYLWANHTQLDRNGKPIVTPTPTPTSTAPTTPTATPSSTSAPSASSVRPSATVAPSATSGPTTVAQAPVGRWLGLDPTVLVVGALALVGMLAAAGIAVRRVLSRR